MNSEEPKNERKEIYHPTIDFVADVEQDVSQVRWRIDSSFTGWAFFEDELKVAPSKEEAYAIAEQKIRSFYESHEREIRDRTVAAKDDWIQQEPLFYKHVDRLFSDYPWPKPPDSRKSYIGYASILNSFPRYIREKSFSFPAHPLHSWHGRAVKVIAHEILHFMEYEYMEKKFGLIPSERGSADNTFWQFTENLNVLIENSDFELWKNMKISGMSKPYPICEELYGRMKEVWDRTQNVDVLIQEIFQKAVRRQG